MSNVKAGDLARIVHPSMYGKFVNVLYETPQTPEYTLPDGFTGINRASDLGKLSWICEAHGARFEARVCGYDKPSRLARYASIGDKWLRPIRGIDGEDEAPRVVGKTVKEAA